MIHQFTSKQLDSTGYATQIVGSANGFSGGIARLARSGNTCGVLRCLIDPRSGCAGLRRPHRDRVYHLGGLCFVALGRLFTRSMFPPVHVDPLSRFLDKLQKKRADTTDPLAQGMLSMIPWSGAGLLGFNRPTSDNDLGILNAEPGAARPLDRGHMPSSGFGISIDSRTASWNLLRMVSLFATLAAAVCWPDSGRWPLKWGGPLCCVLGNSPRSGLGGNALVLVRGAADIGRRLGRRMVQAR